MTKFLNLSIRVQLIVLAILLTLPALGVIIYFGISTRAEDYHKAFIESQKLADNLATELDHLIHESEMIASNLAELPDVRNHNVDKVHSFLLNTVQIHPHYLGILVSDATGKIWASSYPISPNDSIADRRYFKIAQATKRFSSGEYVLSFTSKTPTIHLAYPIMDKNSFRGVVVMSFNLDILQKILGRSLLPENTNYVLVDHNGIIVSRGIATGQAVGKPIQTADLKRMETGPDKDTYEFKRIDGDRRITTYRKIRLLNEQTPFLYVRAGLSVKEALSRGNKHLIYSIAAFLPFVFVTFALASVIAKRSIVDRISKLKIASEQIANGNLSTRIAHEVMGGELGTLGQSLDAMAEKLTLREEALANSEHFLNTIINTEPECVALIDAETRLLMINRAGLEMIQAESFEQVEAHTVCSIVTSEYRDAFMKLTNEVIHGGSGKLQFEIEGLKGRRLWMETHMVPFSNERGEATSALCITRDITEQKKAQHDNATLMQQLAQSQKHESVGRLAGGIAHDFNNLLTPIIGYAELLQKEFAKDSSGAKRLHNILLASDKAKNLVQQLLSFSRKQVLDISILDINPLIVSFQDILRRTLRENIELKLCLTTDIISISADRNQLEQVIMNLVVNAQDAISGNGVITIETASAILDEEFCQKHIGSKVGRYLILTVSDNGCGMDKETQQHLFEPFYTTKGVGHGTGLGLSTVYGIVKQHDGSIWVYSEIGIGTTFKLYFPTVDEHPTKEKPAAVQQPKTQTICNILLVEDNDMVRNMTFELLKDVGFNVVAVGDPEQALRKCDENSFDLLLSDVIMPEMTGPELHSRILKSKPGLKVLFMSGYSSSVVSHHGVLEDGICFIQKPFTLDGLLKKIEEVLKTS